MSIQPNLANNQPIKQNQYMPIATVATACGIAGGVIGYVDKVYIDELKKETAEKLTKKSSVLETIDNLKKTIKSQVFKKEMPKEFQAKLTKEIKNISLKKAGIYGAIGVAAATVSGGIAAVIFNSKNKTSIPKSKEDQELINYLNTINNLSMNNNNNNMMNNITMRNNNMMNKQ